MEGLREKMRIASLIKDRKEYLFGETSTYLSPEEKRIEWENIMKKLHSHGILLGKEFKYLRDDKWPMMRRETMAKLGKDGNMGSAGSPSCSLTPLDKIIIDITDEDNTPPPPPVEVILDEISPNTSAFQPMPQRLEDFQETRSEQNKEMDIKRQRTESCDDEEEISLKRKKEELEIYNLQLDALKKERNLGLKSSHLTSDKMKEEPSGSTQFN